MSRPAGESTEEQETTELVAQTQKEENAFKARAESKSGGSTPDASGRPKHDPSGSAAVPDTEAEDPNSERDEDGLAATKLRQEELRLNNLQQNTQLRKVLAYAAVGMVALQLLTSNLFFAYFLAHNVDDPDARIMIAWLSASVVEVIGILLVVARSLFKGRKKPAS